MRIIKNENLHVSKNEYLHENNQNLNKNGYGVAFYWRPGTWGR